VTLGWLPGFADREALPVLAIANPVMMAPGADHVASVVLPSPAVISAMIPALVTTEVFVAAALIQAPLVVAALIRPPLVAAVLV